MLDVYKNPICAANTISIKISGKKNGLARESNHFYFTFHSLGMESLMMVLGWLQEKKAAEFQPLKVWARG